MLFLNVYLNFSVDGIKILTTDYGGLHDLNRNLRQFEPSLRMCGESIEMTVQYKDGATS